MKLLLEETYFSGLPDSLVGGVSAAFAGVDGVVTSFIFLYHIFEGVFISFAAHDVSAKFVLEFEFSTFVKILTLVEDGYFV